MQADSENFLLSPALVRKPAVLVPLLLASTALVQLALFWRGVQRARALAAQGRRYERRLASKGLAVLILGDSTGVGVGASLPEESIAGLLAADYPQADVVNISESGARIAEAIDQAKRCNAAAMHFDVAILHVGGNDIVRATPTDQLADGLRGAAGRAGATGPPHGLARTAQPRHGALVPGAVLLGAGGPLARCGGGLRAGRGAPSGLVHRLLGADACRLLQGLSASPFRGRRLSSEQLELPLRLCGGTPGDGPGGEALSAIALREPAKTGNDPASGGPALLRV